MSNNSSLLVWATEHLIPIDEYYSGQYRVCTLYACVDIDGDIIAYFNQPADATEYGKGSGGCGRDCTISSMTALQLTANDETAYLLLRNNQCAKLLGTDELQRVHITNAYAKLTQAELDALGLPNTADTALKEALAKSSRR